MNVKGHILLAENFIDYLLTLKQFLEMEGYRVTTASNPSEAENILLTQGYSINLIITDIRLIDDNDAFDESGIFLAMNFAPTIPKIILTSFPTFNMVTNVLSRQPNLLFPPAISFVSKVEGLQKLLSEIERIFRDFIIYNAKQIKIGGALTNNDAGVYVERKAEIETIQHLEKMEYILIIEPRQQGKTSLINFLLRHPGLKNFIFIYIDLTPWSKCSQDTWYWNICNRITHQLHQVCPDISAKNNVENASDWREFLFDIATFGSRNNKNIVIALDEIGAMPIEYANGFFSVLREIFNARQVEPEFGFLTFLLVGVFHPRELIDDEKISPFNVSVRVHLNDFTISQIQTLLPSIGWSKYKKSLISNRIIYWTGGQPYLTNLVASNLNESSNKSDVDQIVNMLLRKDSNHLPAILKRMNQDENTKNFINQIINKESIPFFPLGNSLQSHLELNGIIKSDVLGNCIIRNRIYTQAFLLLKQINPTNRIVEKKEIQMMPSLSPTQDVAITIVKEAISFIVDELKQNWRLKQKKNENNKEELNKQNNIGVSEELQESITHQIVSWKDDTQLKMIIDNLDAAKKMAEKYNTLRNKYRKSLPGALDRAPIEMQIEEAEKNRDIAANEIKAILERLIQEDIVIEQ